MARRPRIECDSQCVLNCNGSSYSVMRENLSLVGALLRTNNGLMNSVKPNDVCDLVLYYDPHVCPT